MKHALYIGAASALAVMIGFSVAANATTAIIDGITVSNLGDVSPSAPSYTQPAAYTSTGAGTYTGQQPVNGWDPYGTSDTAHNWWDLSAADGSIGFNLTSPNLNIVWGSPNANNTVTFYSGANGTGTVIGAVTSNALESNLGPIYNSTGPGVLIDFTAPGAKSAVFSTDNSAFEFAVLGVPEASTWVMMLAGFAALGFAGYRRQKAALSA